MNRAKIYEICKNPWFERTVVTLLFINMLVLALMTFPSIKTSSWFEWLTVLDNIILALFVLELLLRCRGDRLFSVSQKPGACQPGGPRQQQLRIQP